MYFTDSANAQPRPAEPLPLPAAFYYLPPGATQAEADAHRRRVSQRRHPEPRREGPLSEQLGW